MWPDLVIKVFQANLWTTTTPNQVRTLGFVSWKIKHISTYMLKWNKYSLIFCLSTSCFSPVVIRMFSRIIGNISAWMFTFWLRGSSCNFCARFFAVELKVTKNVFKTVLLNADWTILRCFFQESPLSNNIPFEKGNRDKYQGLKRQSFEAKICWIWSMSLMITVNLKAIHVALGEVFPGFRQDFIVS